MFINKPLFLFLIILFSLLSPFDSVVLAADTAAETPVPVQAGKALAAPDWQLLESRINATREKTASAQEAENEGAAQKFGVSLARLQERTARLRELEGIYHQQITALKRQESLQKEQEILDKEHATLQEMLIDQAPPYNLSTYDGLLDQLATADKQEQTADVALKSGRKKLEDAKTVLEQASRKLREAEEELEQSKTANGLLLNWNLEFCKIDRELAQAALDLQRINVANAEVELGLVQVKKRIIQRHVNWAHSRLAYDPDDLNSNLAKLEEQRATLMNRIDTLRTEQQEVEDVWITARQELEAAQAAPDEIAKKRAFAYLKAREAWRETYQHVLEQTENILLFLNHAAQVWKRRYGLLGENITSAQLGNWRGETVTQIESIGRLIDIKENYQEKLQAEIATIQKQLGDDDLDDKLREHLEAHVAAMNKMAERNFEYHTLLQRALAVEQRFLGEIDLTLKKGALRQKLEGLEAQVRELWDFELWVVDERSVTVKKVTTVCLILVFGMLLVRWLARTVIRRFFRRAGFDASATAAVEHLLNFVALLVLVIFALHSVNIPLTIFTFLGGAIAIGVGFGAQNLLNNFISGFILLTERPVKINDMVEVEDNFGIIEKIGMRCTRVRTPGNIHILVPNSSFLEKNIVNWTLSDQEIRGSVALGVAHRSDPRQVSQLMLQAVHEHEKILAHPEPVVLFDEVGDSALRFVVYFWFSMKSLYLLEPRIIESDVRHRVVELFRAAGVTVAYPQRDVHLHSAEPVEMELDAPRQEGGGRK